MVPDWPVLSWGWSGIRLYGEGLFSVALVVRSPYSGGQGEEREGSYSTIAP